MTSAMTNQPMTTSCVGTSGNNLHERKAPWQDAAAPQGTRPSRLARDRTLVPAPQHQMGDKRQREEDDDSSEREEQQRGEHARDVEPIAGFDDAIRKPRAGPGRTRSDLGNHSADER